MTFRIMAATPAAVASLAGAVRAGAASVDVTAAPIPKHGAVPRKHGTTIPAAPADIAAAHPSSLFPPAENAAASLERRRRVFFAPETDEGGAHQPSPPVGVTLGESGGITPGMGFGF